MSDDPPMDRFRGPDDGVHIRSVGERRRRVTSLDIHRINLRDAHDRRIRETGVCGRESCPVCTPRRTE